MNEHLKASLVLLNPNCSEVLEASRFPPNLWVLVKGWALPIMM